MTHVFTPAGSSTADRGRVFPRRFSQYRSDQRCFVALGGPAHVKVARSGAKVPFKHSAANLWTGPACASARQQADGRQLRPVRLSVWLTPAGGQPERGSVFTLCHSEDVHARKERHQVKQKLKRRPSLGPGLEPTGRRWLRPPR